MNKPNVNISKEFAHFFLISAVAVSWINIIFRIVVCFISPVGSEVVVTAVKMAYSYTVSIPMVIVGAIALLHVIGRITINEKEFDNEL
jgi:hypothetical protein